MNILKTMNNDQLTVALEGWLDTQSAPELGAALENLGDINSLVLDFQKLEYISSSGLRQVIAAFKKAKDSDIDFSIVNVGDEVMSVMSLTGLDKKLGLDK